MKHSVLLGLPYNPLEEVGGLELSTLRHSQFLQKNGHEVAILTKGKSGELDGIKIIGFGDLQGLCQYLMLNVQKFDVIHWLEIFPDHGEVDLQGMISGVLRSLGKVVVFMVATSGNLVSRGSGKLTTPLLQKCADAYVISNPDQLDEFASCGINKDVHIVGFGVDTKTVFTVPSKAEKMLLRKELRLPESKMLFLFMGRFVERKRPDFLLRAWQELADIYPDASLVVVGSGMGQDDSIETVVLEIASVVKNVEFRDITEKPEMYYRACDVLLLPSIREGQPNVLMESMACGNLVIGSDIPGISELLINNVTGLSFPAKDFEIFKELVRSTVSNPTSISHLGMNARRLIAEKRELEVVSNEYVKLYTDLKMRSVI